MLPALLRCQVSGNRVQAKRAMPRAPTYKKHQDVIRRIENSASKLRFTHANECLQKLSAIWTCALKKFAVPASGRKRLKNIGLKGRQIITLPGATKCLGLAVIRIKGNGIKVQHVHFMDTF